MSLTIRRVKNISRKKRKSRSRTRIRTRSYSREEFEDDASKFTVIEDFYSENFPPLRPVYRKDIFGTPIVFRVTKGIDYCGDTDYTVKIHSINFMKEYKCKSFEELRWQDYTCGRREIFHYEENSYLRCLSAKVINKINYKFFDPAPKNIPLSLTKEKSLLSLFRNNCSLDEIFSKRIPSFARVNESLTSSIKSSRSFDELIDSEKSTDKIVLFAKDDSILDSQPKSFLPKSIDEKNNVKESRQRSILTYVDKISQTLIKNNSLTKSSSDVCLSTRTEGNTSKQECIEILRTNLVRYFEKAEPTATMPYDFVTQNPKFFLPCAEIGFAYQNARPSVQILEEPTMDQSLTKGHGLSLLLQKRNATISKDHPYKCGGTEEMLVKKYTFNNKFNQEYLWNKFHPYFRSCGLIRRVSRARYILAGRDISDNVIVSLLLSSYFFI